MTLRTRGRRRAFALMLVVVYLGMTLASWSVAGRRTAGLIRLKDGLKGLQERALADEGRTRALALAEALATLEMGPPEWSPESTEPLRWWVAVATPGETRHYVVEFVPPLTPEEGDPDPPPQDRWTIVCARDEASWADFPELPDRFGTPGP